jgi:hypothetical protein
MKSRKHSAFRLLQRISPQNAGGRSVRALSHTNSNQGFAVLTPGYWLAPPSGALEANLGLTLSFETASKLPHL